jgi:hypothetical protein
MDTRLNYIFNDKIFYCFSDALKQLNNYSNDFSKKTKKNIKKKINDCIRN